MKTQDVTGRASVMLAWQRNGRWLSEDSSPPIKGTHDWQRLTVTGTAPRQADSVRVTFGLAYGDGTAWLDDVTLSGISRRPTRVEHHFTDTSDWFAFPLSHDDRRSAAIDLRRYLHAPAGRHGFLQTKQDGHFYFADGTRARFFGVNLGSRDCMPPKTLAPTLARHFAKYGVNLVRLHSLDSLYAALIDYRRGDSRHFDPDALDRLDFFIAELKKQGIYVYLDLLDYRRFRDADGVREGDQFTANWAGSMKGASIFDDRMISLQKEYATALLTHRNPYTNLRLVDDPAIALIEITNENSLFYFLLMKNLSRPIYREALRRRWNEWLRQKYEHRDKLRDAWQAADGKSALGEDEDWQKASIAMPTTELVRFSKGLMKNPHESHWEKPRVRDTLAFLGQLQDRYYREMRRHLKETIGVNVPLTGTNQVFVLKDMQINARWSDFVSRNQYWNHPSVKAKPFMRYANLPMLKADLPRMRTPLAVFGASSVAGKPMVLAEFNFPWPNAYRAEGLIMASAYACLQDWDAVLLFSYHLNDPMIETFRSQADPARWGT
ncbi:MAG TPA: hypothetical protein ENJ50_10065, partial [Planctomycetaceae bacterium]|nr:hypothetical protein [Planctomycetaceae bacterium]